ncbi:MAG: hypothetical protein EBR08_02165 [Bacteroidia bacterium]|nr:hypothetical protein [Bacteroidia bacterium]
MVISVRRFLLLGHTGTKLKCKASLPLKKYINAIHCHVEQFHVTVLFKKKNIKRLKTTNFT